MDIKLREVRESRFMTQRELAEKAKVGVCTIVRIEKGQQIPTFKTIKRIAVALNIEPSQLMRQKKNSH